MSYHLDKGTDSAEFDFLYPVFTYDRFGSEYRFQLGQLISSPAAKTNRRTFRDGSLCFQSTSSNALESRVKLYGCAPLLRTHPKPAFRDEINFAMFPFTSNEEKMSSLITMYSHYFTFGAASL